MIILDTHVLLWTLQDSPRLSAVARSAIRRTPRDQLALSALSLYEIAWLVQRGRIEVGEPVDEFLRELQREFNIVAPDVPIALAAAQLSSAFPSDPLDRIIAGTALVSGAVLITADERIRRSGAVRTIW